jgi:hypothetical protein
MSFSRILLLNFKTKLLPYKKLIPNIKVRHGTLQGKLISLGKHMTWHVAGKIVWEKFPTSPIEENGPKSKRETIGDACQV